MQFKTLVRILFVAGAGIAIVVGMNKHPDSDGSKTSKNLTSIPPVTKFEMHGNEKLLPYEKFNGLPKGICSTLETLNLTFVELDPNALVKSLQNCTKLTTLILENVELSSRITGAKVMLPELTEYTLTMHQFEADTAEEFMAHIFFYKNFSNEVMPTNISVTVIAMVSYQGVERDEEGELNVYSLDYDVTPYFEYATLYIDSSFVDFNTVKWESLTRLRQETGIYPLVFVGSGKSAGRLTSLFLKQTHHTTMQGVSVTIDLSSYPALEYLELHNLHVFSSQIVKLNNIRYLRLVECELSLTSISISNHLSELYLYHVEFGLNRFEPFIFRMDNLTTLRYTTNQSRKFDLMSLSKSANTLTELRLGGLNIRSLGTLQFVNLKQLEFQQCTFMNPGLLQFNKTFPSVNIFAITRTNISSEFFKRMLDIPSLELVYVLRNDSVVPHMSTFMLRSGVPDFMKSFSLRKSNESATGWSFIPNPNTRENPQLRDIVINVYLLSLITFCGIGILGNTLSAIVLTRKNMRSSTSCILLGLSLCDTIVIVTYVGSLLYFGSKLSLVFLKFTFLVGEPYFILGFEVTPWSMEGLDQLQYRFLYPLNKIGYTGSVYATILLTIERYSVVCWPLHARSMFSTKRAMYAMILVLGFSMILNIPRWIESRQNTTVVSPYYIPQPGVFNTPWSLSFERSRSGLLRHRYYIQVYHGWLWITLMYVLPISGLCYFNYKILKELKRSKENRKRMVSSAQQNQNQEELASLTRMLLVVIMVFVLCNSLSGGIVWVLILFGWHPSDIEVFSCIPLIVNSAVNFVIYVLLGKKFRAEMLHMLQDWRQFFSRNQSNQFPQNNFHLTGISSSTT